MESHLWKSSKKEGVWGFPFIQPVVAAGSSATSGCLSCKILGSLCNTPVLCDTQIHYRLGCDVDWHRIAALASPHASRQQTAPWEHHGLAVLAWPGISQTCSILLIRSLLPYQMKVPNCYFLNRHVSMIFNEGEDVGKEKANIRNCLWILQSRT